jgi:CubicO group peptidase (beta-lactamase class C family)
MQMKARANRREVTRWMLSASVGGLAAVKFSAATTVLQGAASKVNFDPVRDRIHQTIAQGDATGVAVAVVQGGRIVWEEGFGWANQNAGLKATPHTPFGMASITKPFTATTIMTLVAEGKLSPDESANRYLAGCKLLGTGGNAEAVNVRQLGAHVSGLPGMSESYEADEASLVPSPNTLLQTYGRLAYPPALCYEYSNLGFAALNAIASTLTHTGFGALTHRRVLAPLPRNINRSLRG